MNFKDLRNMSPLQKALILVILVSVMMGGLASYRQKQAENKLLGLANAVNSAESLEELQSFTRVYTAYNGPAKGASAGEPVPADQQTQNCPAGYTEYVATSDKDKGTHYCSKRKWWNPGTWGTESQFGSVTFSDGSSMQGQFSRNNSNISSIGNAIRNAITNNPIVNALTGSSRSGGNQSPSQTQQSQSNPQPSQATQRDVSNQSTPGTTQNTSTIECNNSGMCWRVTTNSYGLKVYGERVYGYPEQSSQLRPSDKDCAENVNLEGC